jgi:hypothetical protein
LSDAGRLQALEDETAKLRKLSAEAMLDNAKLQDVARKIGSRPPQGAEPSLTCGTNLR